jgi:hypothetical protein
MGMYINRVNGTWPDAQQWTPPRVTSSHEVNNWAQGPEFNVYKADVM